MMGNTMDGAGHPIPLTRQEETLRANIQARQKAITDPGSVANIASGTGTFTGAQLVRVALEVGLSRQGTQEAEQLAEGDMPSASVGEAFAKLGYNSAVSAVGGAGLSALVATQKLNATVTVPDATGGAEAPSVELPLFAPQSSLPNPLSPPWGGTASQKLSSLVARFGNLFVAGVSIQAGQAAQKYLTIPDIGKLATVAGQMTGVASYFAGVGKIVANEAARKAQANAAQGPQAGDLEAAAADADAGAEVSVDVAHVAAGAGVAGLAHDPAGAGPLPSGNPFARSGAGAADAGPHSSNPFAALGRSRLRKGHRMPKVIQGAPTGIPRPSPDDALAAANEPASTSRLAQQRPNGLPRRPVHTGRQGDTSPQPGEGVHRKRTDFPDGSKRSDYSKVGTDGKTRITTGSQGEVAATDAHFHPKNYAQRGIPPRQALEWMNKLGIRNTVLMPIPTSIISPKTDAERQDAPYHHCGPTYYIPPDHNDVNAETMTPEIRQAIVQRSELINDSAVDHLAAFDLKRAGLSEAEMSRFDPMITGLHLGADMNTDELLKKLYSNKGVFTGIGEVTLHKELVEEMFAGATQANLTDHVRPFKDLCNVAGVVGMPVVLHCDIDSLDNQDHRGEDGYTPQHLQGLKNLFASPELKDTTIVWAHAGGLGRFITEPGDHTNELQQMFDANPNLKVDISWSQVASQLVKPGAIDRWAAMIEKNPDRFLIGSDALAPADPAKWEQTFSIYRRLTDRLSETARERLLNGNYEEVFVESRAKVRDFEDKVLTDAFYEDNLQALDGRRTTADWLRSEAAAMRQLQTHHSHAVSMSSVELDASQPQTAVQSPH
jgi:hypothetical protein